MQQVTAELGLLHHGHTEQNDPSTARTQDPHKRFESLGESLVPAGFTESRHQFSLAVGE